MECLANRERGLQSHRNGVGHDEETIGEKISKDKRSTTSLHSTVLEYGYDGRPLQSIHWPYLQSIANRTGNWRASYRRPIKESFPWKIQTQISQVLCRKASASRIPGKDHRHQTAVTTFTENGPFQSYTRKTATQIFQKDTKVVVTSQINVSFFPAPIWLSLFLLNLKYYSTYKTKCLNKSFYLIMVLYFAIIVYTNV